MTIKIYPDYTLVLLVFNLLGWWYKGQPFFSWWWFVPILSVDILLAALLYGATKHANKEVKQ